MSKFIAHGIVTQEPIRKTLPSGADCVTLTFEEVVSTSYKKKIATYQVDFMGASAKCVPTGMRLMGVPIVVVGSINAHTYSNKVYYDLAGEQLSIIGSIGLGGDLPTQASKEEPEVEANLDKIEITDDDLPF